MWQFIYLQKNHTDYNYVIVILDNFLNNYYRFNSKHLIYY